jgi:hypothetical protein
MRIIRILSCDGIPAGMPRQIIRCHISSSSSNDSRRMVTLVHRTDTPRLHLVLQGMERHSTLLLFSPAECNKREQSACLWFGYVKGLGELYLRIFTSTGVSRSVIMITRSSRAEFVQIMNNPSHYSFRFTSQAPPNPYTQANFKN